ncbi:hypothetical protein Tcan_12610 [Toxocara canis]|uniref:Uncharacterized protein n=1 Tax=Toxocara canis TaxID=6265 RepID=A0A0B2V0W4_TOXCA|nr:hypothetical protein Tcan_12610 [Toxocara canis]
MSSCRSPLVQPRENVPRKIERILSDMTRQLMANAAADEDIEVDVKLRLGQPKANDKRHHKTVEIKKPPSSMYRMKGCFNATVAVNGQNTVSDSLASTTLFSSPTEHLSSPTAREKRSSSSGKERVQNMFDSSTTNVVTLGGMQGPTTSDISNLYGHTNTSDNVEEAFWAKGKRTGD